MKKGFLAQQLAKAKAAKLAKAAGKKKEGDGKEGKDGKEKEDEKEKEGVKEGPLKGKLVRVVDETSYLCGQVVEVVGHAKTKVHGHLAWKDAMSNFLEKTKAPSKVVLDEKAVLPLEQIPQPELTKLKQLKFKDEERAELEMLFQPLELEKGHKLSKELSLPLMHLEMWLWLLVRDFELKKIERVTLLSPEKMAWVCKDMQLPDAAERFVEQVGKLSVQLQDAKLILLPVWGNNPEHWTLLIACKGEDEKWTLKYKDSLSGFHKGCAENAQRLTTLLSCALMADLKFPEERCNLKFQSKGSLECGFFVCHWLEQAIREELGEGPFAIGLPNVARVYERLNNLANGIIRNKGWAALHAAKAAKAHAALEKRKEEEAKVVEKILKSKEFQDKVSKEARLQTLIPWATQSGCPKCRWKVNGSTCCNPEKIQAKELTLKENDGKFDKDLYAQKLVEVYENLKNAHKSPVEVTELPRKGGGGQKDCYYCYPYS